MNQIRNNLSSSTNTTGKILLAGVAAISSSIAIPIHSAEQLPAYYENSQYITQEFDIVDMIDDFSVFIEDNLPDAIQAKTRENLVDFIRNSPLMGLDLEIKRSTEDFEILGAP